jgi:hypothetical protein
MEIRDQTFQRIFSLHYKNLFFRFQLRRRKLEKENSAQKQEQGRKDKKDSLFYHLFIFLITSGMIPKHPALLFFS